MTLTAGLRYTDDEKDGDHFRAFPLLEESFKLEDDNVSWDASLAYAVGSDAQVYARASSGFRAPTIADRLEDDREVTTADSETIMSYEIGYKALFEKVRLNVAAFYYDIDDIQLVFVGGAANSTTLANADEGIGYGVEFDVDFALTDNLVLSGGFGYNKTKINDNELAIAVCNICTVLDPAPLDEDGNVIGDSRTPPRPLALNRWKPLPASAEVDREPGTGLYPSPGKWQ